MVDLGDQYKSIADLIQKKAYLEGSGEENTLGKVNSIIENAYGGIKQYRDHLRTALENKKLELENKKMANEQMTVEQAVGAPSLNSTVTVPTDTRQALIEKMKAMNPELERITPTPEMEKMQTAMMSDYGPQPENATPEQIAQSQADYSKNKTAYEQAVKPLVTKAQSDVAANQAGIDQQESALSGEQNYNQVAQKNADIRTSKLEPYGGEANSGMIVSQGKDMGAIKKLYDPDIYINKVTGEKSTYPQPGYNLILPKSEAEKYFKQEALQAQKIQGAKDVAGLKNQAALDKSKKSDNTIESVADGIANGQIPADVTKLAGGLGGKGIEVLRVLREKHPEFNYLEANKKWLADRALISTLNQNQQVGLRQSLDTVNREIPLMEGLNDDFQRTNFSPVNKIVLGAALKGVNFFDTKGNQQTAQLPDYQANTDGLNEEQSKVAVRFVSQLNLMKDNMAVAFMRGGVPSDKAFKLADDVLNPLYSNPQFGAALDQVKQNTAIRGDINKNVSSIVPGSKQQTTPDTKKETTTPVTDEEVKMTAPDGRLGMVPKSQFAEALKKGYRKAP